MKTLNTILFSLLVFVTTFAQTPQGFKYQGVAVDNEMIVTGSVGLQLSIISGSDSGDIVYQERHFPDTNSKGVFSVDVGSGTLIQGDWNSINWGQEPHFIKVELDPNGGADYTDMGTSQLLSVPYAMYGEDADADPGNEIQTLSKTGLQISMSNGGGSVEDEVNDADSDPNNEIQTLTLVGSELSLTNGGQVDISGALNTIWQDGSDHTFYEGNVGIGTNTPTSPLTVENDLISGGQGVITSTFTSSSSTDAIGVLGRSVPSDYYGIGGAFEGGYMGLRGLVYPTGSNTYYGLYSIASGGSGTNYGTYGYAYSDGGVNYGVYGNVSGTDAENFGVYGSALGVEQFGNVGVYGESTDGTGVRGVSENGVAVRGLSDTWDAVVGITGGTSGYAIYGINNSEGGSAGIFSGNVSVFGNLSKSSGTFKIDHPQDPANKYLLHSFVESPDMMNVYNGNVTTDENGYANVELPGYFESLNKDFRYQLTVISNDFAQAIIAKKIEEGVFIVRTNKPNIEVSWQVTGIRKDPYANANRIVPEVEKKGSEKGKYLHPEVYDLPENYEIGYERKKRLVDSPMHRPKPDPKLKNRK